METHLLNGVLLLKQIKRKSDFERLIDKEWDDAAREVVEGKQSQETINLSKNYPYPS